MSAIQIFTNINSVLVALFWLTVYKSLKGTIHRNLYVKKRGDK